ncbi:chorismate mutase [Lentzea fradiae]|uniref:Chorismate mutase n=1 Tax=Lentzea fradiae TaxID=200378 RepID=A0A1G7R122_9PSEU|nr:chorismate mutase [Lentzea fradiae]SDG04491.1 chorismate mutase [Lentzea fradiae]
MSTRTRVARGVAALSIAGTVALTTPPASASADESLSRLTSFVVERLRVSDDVAAAKFGTTSPIDDPAREQQVLDQVRTQATALGLDADDAAAFFRDQITASKVVQRGLFARWTARPEEVPTTRPDLSLIRTRLDRLTSDLLGQLKSTEDLRAHRIPCRVHLAIATGSAAVLERLDALHREALGTAVHSVC